MDSNYQASLWEKIVTVVFAFLVFSLVAFLVFKNQPLQPQIASMLRIFISLAVSVLGATVPGFLKVDLSGKGVGIRATGALALFVVTYFFSPKMDSNLNTEPIEPLKNPTPVTQMFDLPRSTRVFAAERKPESRLQLRLAMQGDAPSKQQKRYDLTISNSSNEQVILTTFHVRWVYSSGSLSSVEDGIALRPTEKYTVTIPLDVDRAGQVLEADFPMYPAILLPPANSSGPSVKTIRMEVDYKFSGRLKYHPNEGWELFYDVSVKDDHGGALSLLRRAWQANRNDDWPKRYAKPDGPGMVSIDTGQHSICLPRGMDVSISSFGDKNFGLGMSGYLDRRIKRFKGIERIGPDDDRVLAVFDFDHKGVFSTPTDQEVAKKQKLAMEKLDRVANGESISDLQLNALLEDAELNAEFEEEPSCYSFKVQSFRVDKLPFDDIRGNNWMSGKFEALGSDSNARYVFISGFEQDFQVKITWQQSEGIFASSALEHNNKTPLAF